MIVLLFLVVPMLLVGGYATYTWLRNRQPTSVESGIDAFQREMQALSPDAAPVQRRPHAAPGEDGDPGRRASPRRPGAGDRPDEDER